MMAASNNQLESTRRYRKTKKGVVTNIYHKMKARHPVSFPLIFLHQFAECPQFDRIYSEWVASGYEKGKKPSIDRINSRLGYSPENIHWMTWAENRYKQTMERRRRKGEVAQMMGGEVLTIHKSQREAVKKTGIHQGNISSCLNGCRQSAGGFQWAYIHESPELLTGDRGCAN